MEYRSVADLNRTIVDNLHKVPRDVELVVGIPRSGLVAADLVALYLNLPLADLDGFLAGRALRVGASRQPFVRVKKPAEYRKVLVLDDSVGSGNQIRTARQRLSAAAQGQDVVLGAVFVAPAVRELVDLYFSVCPLPRVFEWNVMHHAWLEYSCVDIDGILCVDPTEPENDDGPRYREFLLRARPLLIPSVPVGWLVTCRLEKYRALTESWLAKHGVAYRELVMMDLPSKAARVAAGSHGKFKANVYHRTGARLFIESSARQASEIAARTGRPVLCMETGCMITAEIGWNSLARIPHRGYRKARRAARKIGDFLKLNNPGNLPRGIGRGKS